LKILYQNQIVTYFAKPPQGIIRPSGNQGETKPEAESEDLIPESIIFNVK